MHGPGRTTQDRQPAAAPYRVIIIDPYVGDLRAHTALLEDAGFEVQALEQPPALPESLVEHRPDVVMLEVNQDGVDALRLVAALRERDSCMKILLLSATAGTELQVQAFEQGGDDFLVKPVVAQHLLAVVRTRARRARTARDQRLQLEAQYYERERIHLALNRHAIVSIADRMGRISYVNDRFCELSGYSRDELLGQNHRVLKSGVHPPEFYQELWRTISRGEVWQGEICNRSRDGRLYWVQSTITPFLDEAGKAYQYISIRTDITHIKAAAERLRLLERAVEASSSGITIADATRSDQPLIYVNPAFERLTGYRADEAVGSNCRFLQGEERQQPALDELRAAIRQQREASVLLRNYRKNGSLFWNELQVAPVHNPDGQLTHFVGIVNDVTKRREAEQALEVHKERLRRGQVHANVGTWEWNVQTGELYWSERIAPLFGYSEGDLETSYENFIQAVHPDDRQGVLDAVQACIEHDIPYEVEHRVVWPDGSVRWLLERGAVTRDADGRPLEMLGVVQDIDDRKRAEQALISARDDAERANRAKSEFLSSMSHELRTPLNAILGFGQLLEYDTEVGPGQQESVSEILRAGRHLLELINEVLDLAKVEAGRLEVSIEPVEIRPVVEECLSLVRPIAAERAISLDITSADAGDGQLTVRADRTRLKQVILNLLSNAIKYNRESGRVDVRIQCPEDAPGCVELEVADTGAGIPAERLEELFQPFHRLGAEIGNIEGTGIGLALARRLVELMQGRIEVDSSPGIGSTFTLRLQREAGPVGAAAATDGDSPALPAATMEYEPRFTVLYIEDNPANLRLVEQLLSRRGDIQMLSAHSGDLGVGLALTRPVDLILLDINLPGMDGYTVLRRLREEPALDRVPVVAVTANAMPRDVERGLAAGFDDYVTKPIDIAGFHAVIDRLLGQPESAEERSE